MGLIVLLSASVWGFTIVWEFTIVTRDQKIAAGVFHDFVKECGSV